MIEIIKTKCTPIGELVPELINPFAKTADGDAPKYVSVYFRNEEHLHYQLFRPTAHYFLPIWH